MSGQRSGQNAGAAVHPAARPVDWGRLYNRCGGMAKKLTEKQAKFARAVAQGMPLIPAARQAGYSDADHEPHRLMQLEHVREDIQRRREAYIQGDLGHLAQNAVRDLLGAKTPANTRWQVAKWVLEAGGLGPKGEAGENPGQKDLTDMDAEELQAAVSAGMGALQELAAQLQGHHIIDGQARPLLDLTPADPLADLI